MKGGSVASAIITTSFGDATTAASPVSSMTRFTQLSFELVTVSAVYSTKSATVRFTKPLR